MFNIMIENIGNLNAMNVIFLWKTYRIIQFTEERNIF